MVEHEFYIVNYGTLLWNLWYFDSRSGESIEHTFPATSSSPVVQVERGIDALRPEVQEMLQDLGLGSDSFVDDISLVLTAWW